jgi:hypothetical protein
VDKVLIMACSATKHPVPQGAEVPAWELYDGMGYRVAKKAERDGCWPADLGVWIFSAAHGLLHRNAPLTSYDQRIDPERITGDWARENTDDLLIILEEQRATDLYLWMGADYLKAFRISQILKRYPTLRIHTSQGGIGEQLSQLRGWIRGPEPEAPELPLDTPQAIPAPRTARDRLSAHLARFRAAVNPAA